MRSLRVYSASQVETFLLCRRKWAWDKRDGIKAPSNASAQEGTDVHVVLEAWLKHATPLNMLTPAGKVAMAGLHLLPAPMTPGLESETQSYVTIGGWEFIVKKDWQRLDIWPPIVGDHKTTKDFRWMKSAEVLKTDVQACLYAAEAMWATGSMVVDLQWTYFRTRETPKADPVRLRVTIEDIAPTIRKICDTVAEMQTIHDLELRALDLPPSAESCDAFGGCFYQSRCNLTPQERLVSIMTQAQRSGDFLTLMQQRQAGAVNPPPQGQVQQQYQPPAGPPQGAPPAPVFNQATGQWEMPAQGAPPALQQQQQPAQNFPAGPAQFQQQPPAGPPAGAAPPARRGPGRPRKPPAETAAAAAPQGQQPPAGPPPGAPPAPVFNQATGQWEMPGQGAPPAMQQPPCPGGGYPEQQPSGSIPDGWRPTDDGGSGELQARGDLLAQLQTLTRQLQGIANTVQAIADGIPF